MESETIKGLKEEIKCLHNTVGRIRKLFPDSKKEFTLDGRLVGDIGEVIAEELFDIKLFKTLKKHYDAKANYDDNTKIQIKATFKDKLTFNHAPDYYIGIQLFEDGRYKVIYNGPGKYIAEHYSHRKHIGKKLLSFPVKVLKEISDGIDESERIKMR